MPRLLVIAGLTAALAFASAGGAGAARPTIPVFKGCFPSAAQVRPASVLLACGDGNASIAGLKWSNWSQAAADAVGTAHQNDCDPTCVAGHFHAYPVVVRLSRPRTCSNGQLEFTRFYYRFTRSKPPGEAHRANTITSPFFYDSGCP